MTSSEEKPSLDKLVEITELKRTGIRNACINYNGLHQQITYFGYVELEPIVYDPASNNIRPEEILARRDEKRILPIMIPAEFAPGSEARKILDREGHRKEVYAVYSLPK
ncbi:hypothetical protein KW787_03710 [Candidatus Pacearchaeota archaeon]|nr:hypothetical protein [Candidatus Pacearchaeota archaeon]